MRTLLETASRGRRLTLRILKPLLAPSLSATLLLAQPALAPPASQPAHATVQPSQSDYAIANANAVLSRTGNADATRSVTREMFRNIGIPPEIADSLGYTDRVVQAETAYRSGTHAPLHEQDVARAVNNFATTLGMPAWTHTTPQEVRKLRVRLFLSIPQLFANHEPPDVNGRRALFSSNMGPLEASFLANTMLFMKVFYPDFQFSDAERAQYKSQGDIAFATERGRRTQLMLDIVQGRSTTVSILDLLPATDHLFQDLGMPAPPTTAQKTAPALLGRTADGKGGL